jgi:hypothetical protein
MAAEIAAYTERDGEFVAVGIAAATPGAKLRERRGFTIPRAKGRAHRIAEAVLIPVAGALAFALFAAAVLF